MQSKILTIGIPTWNRASELKELLGQIEAQYLKNPELQQDIEVLVADNASTDSTEDVVQEVIGRGVVDVRYERHDSNRGGIMNFSYVLGAGLGQHIFVIGDDDRFPDGCLKEMVAVLRLSSQYAAVLFQEPSRAHYDLNPEELIPASISEMAAKYFWYMGNAGLFAIRSDLASKALLQCGGNHLWTCWPQTEVMLRAAVLSQSTHPFLLTGIVSLGQSNHALNTRSSAFYIWETGFLGLLRTAQNVRAIVGEEVYNNAVNYLTSKRILIRHYYRMFRCVAVSDGKEDVKELRNAVRKSFKYSELKTLPWLWGGAIIAWTPRWVARGVDPLIRLFGNPEGRNIRKWGENARGLSTEHEK